MYYTTCQHIINFIFYARCLCWLLLVHSLSDKAWFVLSYEPYINIYDTVISYIKVFELNTWYKTLNYFNEYMVPRLKAV